jgi:hypothetical protein
LRTRLARQFPAQVDDLTDVMIGVSRAVQDNRKPVLCCDAFRRISLVPILGGLLANGFGDHVDGAIEILQYLLFAGTRSLGKLAVAIAHISGSGNLCTDVVVEIAGQVQNQMPDVVAVRKWILPELLVRKRLDPFVELRADFLEIIRKVRTYRARQI